MMYEMVNLELGSLSLPLYGLLMAAGSLLALGGLILLGKRRGMQTAGLCLYGVLSALLGLLIGRGVWCAVGWYDVFFDGMGEFLGIAPFFSGETGSVSMVGVLAGLLLAAPVTAALRRERAADYLDAAVFPALALYSFARLIEPLSGQGYGDMMGYEVCVCWLEAALTLIVLIVCLLLRGRVRRPGTLAQDALLLWALVQIMPESFRCDEVLYVLVFARVTHLGLAITLGMLLIRLLVQGAKQGLDKKTILLEVAGLAAGIGVCIGAIFALDKTNWPKLLVYGVMLLSLAELGFVIGRRIHKEDIR